MVSKFIVITTINEKTKAILDFEKRNDWHLIIVGDKKSSPIDSNKTLTFLSVDDQKKLGLSIVDFIPYNHYTRKNIGYLYAISQGAEIIYDTDDDNIPYSDWSISDFHCDLQLKAESRFVNIYSYFTNKKIWPRGFPLELIKDAGKEERLKTEVSEIGVWQGLADQDPDVDAIYRLVIGELLKFEIMPAVYLGEGQYCPFNSQNTAWNNKAFHQLYLPSTVSFRFTDILRGYVAQRLIWEQGLHLGFCSPTVYQERNSHDLMKDFRDEVDCYLNVQPIVKILDEMQFNGNPGDNLIRLYARLAEDGFVKPEEIKILDAWLADFEKVSRGL